MDQAELTTDQVLSRDIPWETYMSTKLISGTSLQLLRRYDHRSESQRAQLLDDDGPAYVRVFVHVLRDIFKEDTVEYVLAMIDEMLTANPKRARLFHDNALADDDTYEPFLIFLYQFIIIKHIKPYSQFKVSFSSLHINVANMIILLLRKGNWFVQEKSCKILALIVSVRPKNQSGVASNGEASNEKKPFTSIDDVLIGLVKWLCEQLKKPSHPSRGVPTAINCLSTLLKEPVVRSNFVQTDGVKLLVPLICPASTQQSIQLLYETCLCIWLLSYYEPAIEYLATSRTLPRLIDVVKSSTKEKVVRVVVLTLKNLMSKGTLGAQMVDLQLPQVVQSLKAQAWSDEDLLEALNSLEEGLKDNIKKLSSFDKYKQEVLLGNLDWSPMHKDPIFWRENITNFEEHDFQILRVLLTILDSSNDPRTLAVACFDISQFIQSHPAGRIIVTDLKAKERVMKLMNHESAEVTKNALLCIQRLFLGAKYASFLQV
ncbi:vacuolar H+-ATPase subunit H, putative [Medicago truncatula]|uniref:V-type proton ATPase subunit H n=1 Tax=Medicago truncatula TaxID=3880 RepID=G7LFK4_MEDTR|nr:vacuolar H+-ATPase subunit H, putative [Medicago truncatula]